MNDTGMNTSIMTRVIDTRAPRNLIHGVDRGTACRLIAYVKLGMHRLDDHNRIIDHNRDGKHERRQGDEVDRNADKLHHEEGTHKSHRYGEAGMMVERKS